PAEGRRESPTRSAPAWSPTRDRSARRAIATPGTVTFRAISAACSAGDFGRAGLSIHRGRQRRKRFAEDRFVYPDSTPSPLPVLADLFAFTRPAAVPRRVTVMA